MHRRKFWSCCEKKKTHDFDEFLAMAGCVVGKHRWFKPKEATVTKCRSVSFYNIHTYTAHSHSLTLRSHDFIQTADYVTVTVFAKVVDPELSTVKLNEDTVRYFTSQTFNLHVPISCT